MELAFAPVRRNVAARRTCPENLLPKGAGTKRLETKEPKYSKPNSRREQPGQSLPIGSYARLYDGPGGAEKPLIWDKQMIGMGYHYRARYEFILFFEKGKRKLNNLGIPDIIEHPRIHRGYPTEKPSAVSEVLIRQSSDTGQLIVDPFMGSGSTGVAALKNGRMFLGNDLSPDSIAVSRPRLLDSGGIELHGAQPFPKVQLLPEVSHVDSEQLGFAVLA